MNYVWLYVQILLYTLGVPVICGLVVGLCDRLMSLLMGRGFGRGIILTTSIIGTPIHELGHAIMCLLFFHKIDKMVLWKPSSRDGTLGYVTHRYNPKNLYHRLGNIFIGLGPVFSGLGIMTLCMLICFPETLQGYTASASQLVSDRAGFWPLLEEGAQMLPNLLSEWSKGEFPLWGRIIGVIVMLAVSLHISLSTADIRGSLDGVPVYLILTLVVTVIVSLMGTSAMNATVAALQMFSAATFALFMLVFVLALVQLVLGVAVFLIRTLLRLK